MALNAATENISLDFFKDRIVTIYAKQYDKNSRYINVKCYDRGKLYKVPSDCKANVKMVTPDNRAVFNTATINSDGSITVELTESMLYSGGIAKAEIKLYNVDKTQVLSTMNFQINIKKSVYDDQRIIDSDEFNALTQLYLQLQKEEKTWITNENNRISAENIRISNENTRKSNETARVNAENTRNSNENTRKTNENNRISAETARVNAEKNRVTAENNRVTEYNAMMKNAEAKISEAEKVNISSTSSTDSYVVNITNRSGQTSSSPNLLNKISIGTVMTGKPTDSAAASISGNFGSQKLNLTLPVGKTPAFTVGTVTTGSAGSKASATITGTNENPVLNLTIPKGDTGAVANISAATIPYSSASDTSTIKTIVDNKSDKTHTHPYAGSASAGGSANSAVKLDTSTAGSATQPVYFTGGKPVACTYTLGKSVPSNAVFTDTNTWRGIQDNLISDSATDSLSAKQGKALKTLVDTKHVVVNQSSEPTLLTGDEWLLDYE